MHTHVPSYHGGVGDCLAGGGEREGKCVVRVWVGGVWGLVVIWGLGEVGMVEG